ncbi:dihydrodipicolinate synthase family protein [Akkermansiaceae bacterium]|nr:dihydrodipicolinate synthase family protein [Akkermansiaceae bacterium]
MSNDSPIFEGCIPALMTPCDTDGTINYDALVETARGLVAQGMRGVVYCGSMGDWPLLTDQQRMEGIKRLVEAGIPTVVGTPPTPPTLAKSVPMASWLSPVSSAADPLPLHKFITSAKFSRQAVTFLR